MIGSGRRSVVERQPGGEEHRARSPHRDPVHRDPAAHPRDHPAAQQQPGGDSRQRGGQTHPHAGGADGGQVGEHALIPVERRLGGAEVPVVVGDVTGLPGHPRHRQVVAVVGRGRADDVPEQQRADDDAVGEPRRQAHPPESPPPAAHPAVRRARSSIGERHDRRQRGEHAERHQRRLERGRGRDEPRVDVDAGAEPGRGTDLELGEHAGDLRLLLDRQRAGGAGNPDEVGADAAGVGPEVQRAARAGVDGPAWRDGGDRVTEGDDDAVGGGPHEQPVAAGVDARGRNGREDEAARRGQRGYRLTGDRRRRARAGRRTPAARSRR